MDELQSTIDTTEATTFSPLSLLLPGGLPVLLLFSLLGNYTRWGGGVPLIKKVPQKISSFQLLYIVPLWSFPLLVSFTLLIENNTNHVEK